MTETNHSQTIPISPSVFPTKNKKMTEQPHYYKFDIDKIKSQIGFMSGTNNSKEISCFAQQWNKFKFIIK